MYFKVSPYRETLQGIFTALTISEGMIKLSGRDGSGKSALCMQLFRQLEADRKKVLYFVSPPRSTTKMQQQIQRYLSLDPDKNFTRSVTDYLLGKPVERRQLYLIFDDAQLIDDTTFDCIRMLCNIQDNRQTMVKPIICGNEALNRKLQHNTFRTVAQYIGQSFTLPAMEVDQFRDFYWAYWREQGLEVQPPGDKFITALHRKAAGLPGPLLAFLEESRTGLAAGDPAVRPDAASDMTTSATPATAPASPPADAPAGQAQTGTPEHRWLYQHPGLALLLVLVLVGVGSVAWYLSGGDAPQAPETIPAVSTVADGGDQPRGEDNVAIPEPVPAANNNTAADSAGAMDTAVASEAADASADDEAVSPGAADTEAADNRPAADSTATATAEPPPSRTASGPLDTRDAASVADESSVASTAPLTPPLPDSPPGPLDRVRQFIDAWLADWQRRDIDAYLAHYVENYDSPSHESHDAWLAQRRSSIGNARDISIRYEDLELVAQAPDDNAAPLVVRFRMHYEASNYADYTWKELALRDTEDGLRISLERNLEVQPLD